VTSVLAEDPYVVVSRGGRPIVIDPFMLVRIARQDPAAVAPLVAKLDQGDIDAVVLGRDLDAPGAEEWYRDFAFGTAVYEAIRDAYHRCVATEGYVVYVPTSDSCLPAPGGGGEPVP
jgi:hypothetical protein